MRRDRHEQVNVILANVPFDNLDIVLLADLADDLASAFGIRTDEHWSAVLLHTASYPASRSCGVELKSPPKGGGFSPIPRRETLN